MSGQSLFPTHIKLPLFAAKFGSEGSTHTGDTNYTTIADSDIALDPSIFAKKGKLYVRFIYHVKNTGASPDETYIQVYRQNTASAVSGSEQHGGTDATWEILDTGWIDWSSESGEESYQIQIKTTDATETAEFNSAIMLLSYKNF